MLNQCLQARLQCSTCPCHSSQHIQYHDTIRHHATVNETL